MFLRGALFLASCAVSFLVLASALDVAPLAALSSASSGWICGLRDEVGLGSCGESRPADGLERSPAQGGLAGLQRPASPPERASGGLKSAEPWENPNWSAGRATQVPAPIETAVDDHVETGSLPAETWIDPAPGAMPETAAAPVPVAGQQKPEGAAGLSTIAPVPDVLPPEVPAPAIPAVVPTAPAVPLPPARPRESRQASLAPPEDGSLRSAPVSGDASFRRKAAEDLANAYLKALSSPKDVSAAQWRKLMAERIEYFGKPISRSAWQSRKEAFAEKWPFRDYGARPGSVSVQCEDDARCVVRAMVDWTTVDPERSDAVRGTSRLELGVDLAGRQPVISRESLMLIRNTVRRSLKDPGNAPESGPRPPGPIPLDGSVEDLESEAMVLQ